MLKTLFLSREVGNHVLHLMKRETLSMILRLMGLVQRWKGVEESGFFKEEYVFKFCVNRSMFFFGWIYFCSSFDFSLTYLVFVLS